MPTKKVLRQAGWSGSSSITLKRASRSAQAMANISAAIQPKLFSGVQVGEIEHERRRDAEIDEIGERIELGAEPRRALERARDPAVEAVEHGGGDDGDDRPFDRALHREADRGQAEAERQQRDEIGHQQPQRHRAGSRARGSAAGRRCERRLRRRRLGSSAIGASRVSSAEMARGSTRRGADLGDHRLAGDRARPSRPTTIGAPVGQIDVDARAEADEAETLARAERAPSWVKQTIRRATKPGDLHHAEPPAGASMTMPLRSLSSLALSRSALRNSAGL